jgi:cytosine/adenosine deaminase-related metal-dependent hydrolase
MTGATQRLAPRLPNVELAATELGKCREYMRYCYTLAALSNALSALAAQMRERAVPLAELYDNLFGPPERRDETGPEGAAQLVLRAAVRENQDISRHVLNRVLEDLLRSDEEMGEMRYTVVYGVPARVVGVTREGIEEVASRLDTVRPIMCP